MHTGKLQKIIKTLFEALKLLFFADVKKNFKMCVMNQMSVKLIIEFKKKGKMIKK